MPGPEFPTGGLIMGNFDILKAYQTKWEHGIAVKVTGALLEKLWLTGFSRVIQEMRRKAFLVLEGADRNAYTVVPSHAG